MMLVSCPRCLLYSFIKQSLIVSPYIGKGSHRYSLTGWRSSGGAVRKAVPTKTWPWTFVRYSSRRYYSRWLAAKGIICSPEERLWFPERSQLARNSTRIVETMSCNSKSNFLVIGRQQPGEQDSPHLPHLQFGHLRQKPEDEQAAKDSYCAVDRGECKREGKYIRNWLIKLSAIWFSVWKNMPI